VASEERAHAAAVRASEEVALRRVEEKKRTARKDDGGSRSAAPAKGGAAGKDDPRKALRAARDRAAQSERRVAELEAEVGTLTSTLDDPALYTRPDGVQQAHTLGVTLDKVRARLDQALASWERETAALESLERTVTS
jgi:hypothetical protein